MRVCTVCAMDVCVPLIGVCGSVDSNRVLATHISGFFFIWFALLDGCCCCCRTMYVACIRHTVPQAFELSTLWQPRYNDSRTASLCGPLFLCMCWHCICVREMCVCCDTWTRGMRYFYGLLNSSNWILPGSWLILLVPFYFLSSTAAYAPCFLRHQLWLLCYLRVPF